MQGRGDTAAARQILTDQPNQRSKARAFMKTEYDFSQSPTTTGRPVKRKTRITIYLDDEVLQQFRSLSEQSGKGYQTLINAALRTRLSTPQLQSAGAD
jgi:uncharacterized protein (DUF4415 family)